MLSRPLNSASSSLANTSMKIQPSVISTLLASSVFFAATAITQAQIVRVSPGDFTPLASVITFSEAGYPVGTANPVYTLATASLGSVTVSFGQSFVGQTVTGGGVRTITGLPTGPLTLVATGTSIVGDG